MSKEPKPLTAPTTALPVPPGTNHGSGASILDTLYPDPERQRLMARARYLAEKSLADNTTRAYESDWLVFTNWCARLDEVPLPAAPATVAMFITSEHDRNLSPSTIERRLAAIRAAHFRYDLPLPTESVAVIKVMRGIRRDRRATPNRKKAALADDVKRLVDHVRPQTARGLRDRALLLFGFAGAFRRSELVAIDVADIERDSRGIHVLIRASKTDQEGKGRTVGIRRIEESDYCPVQALDDWLTVAGITQGPVFRRMRPNDHVGATRLTDRSVALILKEHAVRAGFDPDLYAGHSLRRGFLTSAANAGTSIWDMSQQSGHKSFQVLREYVEKTQKLDYHPGSELLK
ncbi:MAG: tyrosine-type recombinase/integrase [Burkholderiales bacterium]|nr:tyrosine-type recombinase/integrase [Burkholderiales bacterium]